MSAACAVLPGRHPTFMGEALSLLVPMGEWFELETCVYFLECNSNLVKIGWTTDLPARLIALRSASPYELRVAAVLRADRAFEQAAHTHFWDLHVRKEWFALAGGILEFLAHPAVEAIRGAHRSGDPRTEPTPCPAGPVTDGSITVATYLAGISLAIGTGEDALVAILDLAAAERHVATMQRAIKDLRGMRAPSQESSHLTTNGSR